jgi:hypothetical protein
MTRPDPGFDPRIADWLEEDPDRAPPTILQTVLAAYPSIPQRRRWRVLGREPRMFKFVPVAMAAAAVLVVAVLVGINFLPREGGIGGPRPTSPAATPTPRPAALPSGESQPAPGRHFTDLQGFRYTINIPAAGWAANPTSDGTVILKDAEGADLAGLFIFGAKRDLYTEPCQWRGTQTFAGETADEFATALAGLDGFESSEPADVTISGYHGKRLRLTVPDDVDVDACDDGQYRSYEGKYYWSSGQVDEVLILDLDGGPHLIVATYQTGTPRATVSELTQILDSLEIEPASP